MKKSKAWPRFAQSVNYLVFVCDKALSATDLLVLLYLPSLRILEVLLATGLITYERR